MDAAVYAFAEDAAPADRLAAALGLPRIPVDHHVFPDGESLPSVPEAAETALVYRSLARPDPKLMPLLLAADALRRAGARRIVLVAPYMPYLRQDAVFAPGQPLSRDVLGGLLGPAFPRIVTVEPHLHRTRNLSPPFHGAEVTPLSAAGLLARAIGREAGPLIVGPDAESAPWTQAVAQELGADCLVLEKRRHGDREVEIALPPDAGVFGRRVVLVDDICASGGTLEAATRQFVAQGAAAVEAAVVHALFDARAEARLRRAGARRIVSTDSCPHPTNAIHLAGLLAGALERELAP